MDLRLKVVEGKHTGQEVMVSGNRFLIGRAEDCQLRPGSDLVSRHHCVLMVEDGYIGVRDFGSRNGTFVNSERIVGEVELKPGDRLKVGPLEFEIHVAHHLGAKKLPPVADAKEAVARAASKPASGSGFDLNAFLSDDGAPQSALRDTVAAKRTSDTDEISTSDLTVSRHPAPRPAAAAPEKVPERLVETAVEKVVEKAPAKPTAPKPAAAAQQPAAPAPKPAAPAMPAPGAAAPGAATPVAAVPAASVSDKVDDLGSTREFKLPPPEEPAAETPAKPAPGTPGKLPPLPKSNTKDSRAAAANFLSKMRRRP